MDSPKYLLKPNEIDEQYLEFEEKTKELMDPMAARFFEALGRLDQELRAEMGRMEKAMNKRWNNIGEMNKQELDDHGYL